MQEEGRDEELGRGWVVRELRIEEKWGGIEDKEREPVAWGRNGRRTRGCNKLGGGDLWKDEKMGRDSISL